MRDETCTTTIVWQEPTSEAERESMSRACKDVSARVAFAGKPERLVVDPDGRVEVTASGGGIDDVANTVAAAFMVRVFKRDVPFVLAATVVVPGGLPAALAREPVRPRPKRIV
jgi:hypothetical protein